MEDPDSFASIEAAIISTTKLQSAAAHGKQLDFKQYKSSGGGSRLTNGRGGGGSVIRHHHITADRIRQEAEKDDLEEARMMITVPVYTSLAEDKTEKVVRAVSNDTLKATTQTRLAVIKAVSEQGLIGMNNGAAVIKNDKYVIPVAAIARVSNRTPLSLDVAVRGLMGIHTVAADEQSTHDLPFGSIDMEGLRASIATTDMMRKEFELMRAKALAGEKTSNPDYLRWKKEEESAFLNFAAKTLGFKVTDVYIIREDPNPPAHSVSSSSGRRNGASSSSSSSNRKSGRQLPIVEYFVFSKQRVAKLIDEIDLQMAALGTDYQLKLSELGVVLTNADFHDDRSGAERFVHPSASRFDAVTITLSLYYIDPDNFSLIHAFPNAAGSSSMDGSSSSKKGSRGRNKKDESDEDEENDQKAEDSDQEDDDEDDDDEDDDEDEDDDDDEDEDEEEEDD